MYNQGVIEDPVVSWALRFVNNSDPGILDDYSAITFGSKNKTEYIGDSQSIDLKSEDEDDGIWQVKYSGTKFTAASSSLTATVVGSSDDNDIYKDEFTRGTAKRALLSSTAVNITLPLTEW
jgi:hypothetical protein